MRITNACLLIVPIILLASAPGCYTGYAIKPDDLSKVQSGVEEKVVTLDGQDGDKLVVTENSAIQVVDHDGLTYRLQPFNFKLTATQLVAPEQDLVLPIGTIDRITVRKLNYWGTLGLIGLGAAAATGVVIGVVATAGEQTGFE